MAVAGHPVHTIRFTPAAKRNGAVAFAVLLAGGLLVVAGLCTLANGDTAANWIVAWAGRWGAAATAPVADLYPPGIACGLFLLVVGALLVAATIEWPMAGAPESTSTPPPRLVQGQRPGLAIVVAVLLAILATVALAQPEPGLNSVALWIATLAAVGWLAHRGDRIAGTAFGNPFSRAEWVGLATLVMLDVVLVARDLTDWRWAGIPDESFFYAAAKAIVDGRLRRFPLSEDGVFGYHPLLSSYYQALFMKLFGADIFGWRLSSVAALALSLPSVYLLSRQLWSRRAAWIAAVLFGTAQVAVGFAHLGYNNVQVYPVLLGALAVLSWSMPAGSLCGAFTAGCLAGLGFYTYYPARLAPLLVMLLLWSFGGRRRQGRAIAVPLFAGMVLGSLPVLVHPANTVSHMLRQTAIGGAPGVVDWSRLLQSEGIAKILHGWALTLLYAQWSRCGWNFEWVPAVDPVTAALSVVGWWLAVAALVRRHRLRFFVPAYLLSSFVVGAVSQYECPPLTRLLTLVPFTAMLAAIALDQLMSYAAKLLRPGVVALVGSTVLVTAVVWNVSALHRSMYERHHGYGNGTTGELVRIVLQLPATYNIVYIQHSENDMYDVDLILDEYHFGERSTYIRPFSARVSETLDRLTPPFAVVYDLRDDQQKRAVEAALARRFPDLGWRDSDPGQPWNLRYGSLPTSVVAP